MNLLHNLKYAFLSLLRNKTTLIWTLIFPIGLATFMNAAFGNLFEKEELFDTIPIAVVQQDGSVGLAVMVNLLSQEEEDALFRIKTRDEAEAKELLQKDEIKAILYFAKEPRMEIQEEGIEVTIIKKVLEEYQKTERTLKDIANKDFLSSTKTAAGLLQSENNSYYTEVTSSNGMQNEFYSYFYAIFAMSCLFASFAGAEKINKLQANESALGMRRGLSGTPKAGIVIGEFISMAIVQFVIEVIVLLYLTGLGIHFGNRYPAIVLTLFLGSCIGISLGMILGSFYRLSDGARNGLCVSISMILSVLSDLCVAGVKNSIEHSFPIINRLNPAALISDSLYSLNVYDTYDRYIRNTVTLGIMAGVMVIISFMILRRNKYASI